MGRENLLEDLGLNYEELDEIFDYLVELITDGKESPAIVFDSVKRKLGERKAIVALYCLGKLNGISDVVTDTTAACVALDYFIDEVMKRSKEKRR